MALNPCSLLRPIGITDTGTYSRNSIATFYSNTGYRIQAGNNTPRFAYDPITLVPQGLLLEGATTNRLLQSNSFSSASWTLSACTEADFANQGASNQWDMAQLTATATTAVHSISQVVVVPATAQRTFHVDVRAASSGNCTHAQLVLGDGTGTNAASVNVKLSDGTISRAASAIGTVTGATASVQALANSVFRVMLTATVPGTTARVSVVMLNAANAATTSVLPSIALTTTDLMYAGCAQFEDGTATSYIETYTATTTRLADSYSGVQMLSNVPENLGSYGDPSAWISGANYTAGQQVSRAVTNGIHAVYQCILAATALSTPPESDTTHWIYVSPTVRWKMFDAANETQTTNVSVNDIQLMLQPGALCDSIAFDNLDADTVRVYVQGTSYDKTIQLKTRPVSNWFQYFFEPFKFLTTAVFTGLPLVTTNVIQVVLTKSGSPPKVGTCVPALQRVIGYAEPGAQTGIIDYSAKSTDQFGSTVVTKRAYSKRMTLAVVIDNSDLDAVQDLLAKYRSTPVVWLGAAGAFTSLVVYGYYKSFDNVIAYPTQSRCNIEIEGLT